MTITRLIAGLLVLAVIILVLLTVTGIAHADTAWNGT